MPADGPPRIVVYHLYVRIFSSWVWHFNIHWHPELSAVWTGMLRTLRKKLENEAGCDWFSLVSRRYCEPRLIFPAGPTQLILQLVFLDSLIKYD